MVEIDTNGENDPLIKNAVNSIEDYEIEDGVPNIIIAKDSEIVVQQGNTVGGNNSPTASQNINQKVKLEAAYDKIRLLEEEVFTQKLLIEALKKENLKFEKRLEKIKNLINNR